ncbi:histone methyltransferase set2 [Rhizophlyctis rosea]|nr:histone methyltransferase set2 [Rhizophlyctis rosea]
MAVESVQKPRAMKQEAKKDVTVRLNSLNLDASSPMSETQGNGLESGGMSGNGVARPPSARTDQPICASPDIAEEIAKVYTHISKNEYKGKATGRNKQFNAVEEVFRCECTYVPGRDMRTQACGVDSDCINRTCMLECAVDDCPAGEHCQNRNMQLKRYPRIEVFRTEKKGFGLRALEDIHAGLLVIEYCGEVITKAMFHKRIQEYHEEGAKHFYFMQLKDNETIDAYRKGNHARFMNHSCEPNCQLTKWVVGPHLRLGIFANQNISAGNELTFDYQFQRYGMEAQRCYCGAAKCKGFIGGEGRKYKLDDSFEDVVFEDDVGDEILAVKRKKQEDDPEYTEEEVDESEEDQIRHYARFFALYGEDSEKMSMLVQAVEKMDSARLRTFVGYQGLVVLKGILRNHFDDTNIVGRILSILLRVDKRARDEQVLGIEPYVEELEKHADEEIAGEAHKVWMARSVCHQSVDRGNRSLQTQITKKWKNLTSRFKKARKEEPGVSARTASMDPATPDTPSKRSFDDVDGEAHTLERQVKRARSDEEGEGVELQRRNSISSTYGYRRTPDYQGHRPSPQDPHRADVKPSYPRLPAEGSRFSPHYQPRHLDDPPSSRPPYRPSPYGPYPSHGGPPSQYHSPYPSSPRPYHGSHASPANGFRGPPPRPHNGVRPPSAEVLPPDWRKYYPPDGSWPYYYNIRTNKTSWDPPRMAPSPTHPAEHRHEHDRSSTTPAAASTPSMHYPPADGNRDMDAGMVKWEAWSDGGRTPPYQVTEAYHHRDTHDRPHPHDRPSSYSNGHHDRHQQEEWGRERSGRDKHHKQDRHEVDMGHIEKKLKDEISNIVVKQMSKVKDSMTKDKFKKLAKALTEGLVDKELRSKNHDNGFKGLSTPAIQSVKKYVKEYLRRHQILPEKYGSSGGGGEGVTSSPP